MAVASFCKRLSSKLYLSPWASCRTRLKDRTSDVPQLQLPGTTTPICHVWAGSNYTHSKLHEQPSVREGKPKFPPNVFIMYVKKVQEQILKDNPNISRTEVIAIASQQWKNVDPEEKSHLAIQRKELYEKYKNDIKIYYDNMTPEEIKLDERKKQQKMLKKLQTARKELGMPKMPAASFGMFMAENYSQHAGSDKVTVIFKKLKDQWKNMSDAEKAKYKEQSLQSSENYKVEMERWEKEMMELGRFDVIRKSTLMRLAMGNKPKKSKKLAETEEL